MGNVDWAQVALLLTVLVPSVILHEVAHGAVANLLGDDTAKRAGRLSLNPARHVDPFGTFLLPLMLSLSGVGAFGYAKPVPVNPSRLRNPRRDSLLVSLAGPATNIALALVATLLLRTVFAGQLDRVFFSSQLPLLVRLVLFFGFVNVLLAVFNLLPIPPLDGSALVEHLLPASLRDEWDKVRKYGMLILLVIVLARPGALDRVFDPALRLWERLL